MSRFSIPREIEFLFKKKSKKTKKEQYGLGTTRYLTIKTRIAEWVKKVWDHLDTELDTCVSNARLCQELGTTEITPYVRQELRKRGILLTRFKKNNRTEWWGVRRCA